MRRDATRAAMIRGLTDIGVTPADAAAQVDETFNKIASLKPKIRKRTPEEREAVEKKNAESRVGQKRVRPAQGDDPQVIFTCLGQDDEVITAMSADGIGYFTPQKWDALELADENLIEIKRLSDGTTFKARLESPTITPGKIYDGPIATREYANPLMQEIKEIGGAAIYDEFKRIRAEGGKAIDHWVNLNDDEQIAWERLADRLSQRSFSA